VKTFFLAVILAAILSASSEVGSYRIHTVTEVSKQGVVTIHTFQNRCNKRFSKCVMSATEPVDAYIHGDKKIIHYYIENVEEAAHEFLSKLNSTSNR